MPDLLPSDLRPVASAREAAHATGGSPAQQSPAPPSPAADTPSSTARRAEEHRAVGQLADGLLPDLIAKLVASGLAELEVREGPWKIRLRRPPEAVGTGQRAADRQLRLPGGTSGAVGAAGPASVTFTSSLPGQGQLGGSRAPASGSRGQDPGRPMPGRPTSLVASPAVGIFRPRPGVTGTRVQAGDRLGAVEMLGIPQEVLAPLDGLVGGLLAETGEGVEYGQALIEIRPHATSSDRDAAPADRDSAQNQARSAGQPAAVAGERS